MYPSGKWEGFWIDARYGRQSMTEFTLAFANGDVSGGGMDIIAPFTFVGSYDVRTGEIVLLKQYLGKHRVIYKGMPDGEGSIHGSWNIGPHTGTFALRPVLPRPRGDERIEDMI